MGPQPKIHQVSHQQHEQRPYHYSCDDTRIVLGGRHCGGRRGDERVSGEEGEGDVGGRHCGWVGGGGCQGSLLRARKGLESEVDGGTGGRCRSLPRIGS